MALTWVTLLAGVFVTFLFPVLVFLLNRWRAKAGWWLMGGIIAIVVVGNLLEKLWFNPFR